MVEQELVQINVAYNNDDGIVMSCSLEHTLGKYRAMILGLYLTT